LATIPITGTGINPARSLGAAIIYNRDHAWDDQVYVLPFLHNFFQDLKFCSVLISDIISGCVVLQWIFWVGPFIGAALAALYHQIVIRAIPFKARA